MPEPIIELGTITEVDEANSESTFRNTSDGTEITLGTFIEIVGAGFGDASTRVPESFFESLDVDTTTTTTNIDFQNTVETPVAEDPATNTVTLDLSTSNWFDPIAATENITVEFTNVDAGGNQLTLYFTDGDAMGPYTITWPASVVWPNGNPITEIPASGNIEIFLLSPDGGTTWRARRGGRNFA